MVVRIVPQAPDSGVAAVRLNAMADTVEVVHQFSYWVVGNGHAHADVFDMDLKAFAYEQPWRVIPMTIFSEEMEAWVVQ